MKLTTRFISRQHNLVILLLGSWWILGFAAVIAGDDELRYPSQIVQNYDETGRKLPPGVPRTVHPDGTISSVSWDFTTAAYQREAFRLVVQEANQVAEALQLSEQLPITGSNVTQAYIGKFGFAYAFKMIGNITTKNYWYCMSVDNKFSSLSGTHEYEDCQEYAKSYTWPLSRLDTNQAFQLATQWLIKASMDVKSLNRDCEVIIEPDRYNLHPPPGKFVPVYCVRWRHPHFVGGSAGAASVMLFLPKKLLMDLSVKEAKYILRKPLQFTNLAVLFPGVAPIVTNYLEFKPVTTNMPAK